MKLDVYEQGLKGRDPTLLSIWNTTSILFTVDILICEIFKPK